MKAVSGRLRPLGRRSKSAANKTGAADFANAANIRRMRLRPAYLPFYWQKITRGRGMATWAEKRDWQLVLNAQDIPFIISDYNGQSHIYAPPLEEGRAKSELDRYQAENLKKSGPQCPAIIHKNPARVLWFLLIPVVIHFLNNIHLPWQFLPRTGAWIAKGCLGGADILYGGEWFRIFTALTLHADLRHLAGNLLFGGLFLLLLARSIGWGRSLLACVLAGGMGNAASVLIHAPGYRSVGFSTAIFASLGCLAGVVFWQAGKGIKMLLPLGAALGLLGLLGTEGQNTDYAAHLLGLFSGFALGLLAGRRQVEGFWLPSQKLSALLGISVIFLAWILAFWRDIASAI